MLSFKSDFFSVLIRDCDLSLTLKCCQCFTLTLKRSIVATSRYCTALHYHWKLYCNIHWSTFFSLCWEKTQISQHLQNTFAVAVSSHMDATTKVSQHVLVDLAPKHVQNREEKSFLTSSVIEYIKYKRSEEKFDCLA